jgi:hypothetical protein
MGDIKDIVGAKINNEVFHWHCLTAKEQQDITRDQVISRDDIEDNEGIYFCDRCKKAL